MPRPDGRAADELRPITFERDYTEMADRLVLVSFGRTRVLCTASIDEDVPRWMRGTRQGLGDRRVLDAARVVARACRPRGGEGQAERTDRRDPAPDRPLPAGGVRHAVLGERQVVVDCDVLQADGGTRTASICGGYLALHDALARLVAAGRLAPHPLHSYCAAISVGIVGGVPVLDLPYVEDARPRST